MPTETLPSDYYGAPTVGITDWGLMVDYPTKSIFRPGSVDELSAILGILVANPANHGRIRVLGGQHSCSDIYASDIVIDTSGLPLEFTVNGNQVVASAWMHAHDFLSRAADHNLSLTALGGTDAQTLAGLISTNTAGATVHTSVYETVDWIEYLAPAASGMELRVVKKTDPLFQALVCSLGCLGVLTRVGFTLVPQRFFNGGFTLQQNSDILGNLQHTCDTHDFWRIEWLPKNDTQCLMWSAKAVAQAPADGDYPPDETEAQLLAIIKQYDPTPFLNDALAQAYEKMIPGYHGLAATGPMRLIIPCDRLAQLRCAMAEWSFNPADLARVQDVCRNYFNANLFPNLAVEIECTRTDSYLMSAWNWPGLPYIIKFNFQYLTLFLDDAGKQAIINHLQGLWNALNDAKIPFKAHWGKINFLTPDDVATRYQWAAFKPHVHPAFVNPYLAKRFGI